MNNKKTSATIEFFAIYGKDRKILVLPVFLINEYKTLEEMKEFPIVKLFQKKIIIPSEPGPWSQISEDADSFFLALQSRKDWGTSIDEKTNLLKVEAIRKVVELMQNSLNNFTWNRDILANKFNFNQPQDNSKEKNEVEAGQNWKPGDDTNFK